MNIKTMNKVSLVINVVAVITCTVALVMNLMVAQYLWAAVMAVLIVMNSYYVKISYDRIKELNDLYKDMNHERY